MQELAAPSFDGPAHVDAVVEVGRLVQRVDQQHGLPRWWTD
jgi:hypothetical protein